jgi:HSP20 family protein
MSEIAVRRQNGGELRGPLTRREFEPFRLMREVLGWDPFREIAPLVATGAPTYAPAFDVKETKDAFVFKADVPGLEEKDLDVTVTGNRLSIAGKRETEKEEKEGTYYAYERTFGSFSRSFTLPTEVDTAHVKAELKAGELTVVIPKTPAAVAKKIQVGGADKPKS